MTDPLSPDELRELEWWHRFTLAFHPDDLPNVGTPLLGHRLVVCVRDRNGELVPWSQHTRRR